MPKYLLITSTGLYAPRFEHNTIESAQNEALRLCNLHNCSVKIVQVVGKVIKKEVPVTELKPVIEMIGETRNDTAAPDELPF